MKKTLLLLDSNSLINRAYYAIRYLSTSDGIMTNAVYGYLSMLSKVINELKPDYVCAAFDMKKPTFRHEMFEGYKANRKGMPDELAMQLPVLKEILASMNIKIVEAEGYEADDIIGTLANNEICRNIIISGDRDLFQLASEDTEIWYTKKGVTEIEIYDMKRVSEEYGSPQGVIELKSIMGDKADNIPGVTGIGETGAKKLLSEYNSLDCIYENIEKLQGSIRTKLQEGKEQAYLSKKLATINRNAAINVNLEDGKLRMPFSADCKKLLERYELKSLISRFSFDGEKESVEKVELNAVIDEIERKEDIKKAVEYLKDKEVAFLIGKEDIKISGGEKEFVIKLSDNLIAGIRLDEALTEFSELLTKNEIIFYDYKSIKKLLKNYDIEGNCSFDVMIAEFLITQNSTDNLSKIADRYGYELSAYALLKIKEKEKEKLFELGLDKVFYDIEMPLLDILYDMEETGFRIDKKILDEFSIEFNEEILEITEKIYELAGYSFNINSTKQLSELLFDKLGLKPGKKTKSGLSSDKEVLIKLVDKHPIIPLILRYRQITKLQSTYIDGIRNLISKKGRVHTSFKQAFVSTGRLSSTEPNLQNIPIRNSEGARLRNMFIASEGNELVAADYSQIELRLLAHLSEDEKLISAFNSNVDIHAKTASEVFNVDLDMVTDEMRRSAKAVNFGIIYGISNYGLSENLKISPQTAKKFIEDYFEKYPKVRTYMENNVKFAKEKGYAKSMFGRIRYLPEIKSSNYNIRSFNERIAMNMPLQGTAADIIKIAMIDTVKELNKHNLKAKLILQVHDELIIDTPKEEVEEVKNILKNCMEHVAELKVPLAVNIGVSSNWLEAK